MRFCLLFWLLCDLLLPIRAMPLDCSVRPETLSTRQRPLSYEVSPDGLMRAIDMKDVQAVATLLRQGVGVSVYLKEWDSTPLMNAVICGQSAIVKMLLERGAEITARNSSGETVLHYAAENSQPEILKLLLEHGGRNHLHMQDEERWTPLHRAAREADIANVRLLLEFGAAPNARGAFQQTPLMEAVRGGKIETIRLLLERGADPSLKDTSGGTALMLTADGTQVKEVGFAVPQQRHLLEITKAILAKGEVRNEEGGRALRLAVESGHSEIADVLLKAGAPAKGVVEARFLLAVEKGDLPAVERFLNSGVSVDVVSRSGHTALMTAALNGNLPLVNRLIAKGANVNKRSRFGETPLLCAIDYPQIVKVLLAKGAYTNVRVLHNRTVLMYATDNLAVAKLLLDIGANVGLQDDSKATAFIHSVQRKGNPAFLRKLLNRGMSVNAPQAGLTPLMWAAKYGKVEAVGLLLQCGANVRVKDRDANTALHHAIRNSSAPGCARPIVEMLLNRGAFINARNNAGETPLTLALKKESLWSNADLAFLRERGAIGDNE